MKNMKKRLNSKGFTLIELLAVIVILSVILVIAVPKVLDAMDSSRKSALHSSAKGVSNWYSETSIADAIVPESDRTIPTSMYGTSEDGTKIEKNKWLCMDKITAGSTNLLKLAGVSENDVVTSASGGSVPSTGTDCSAAITPSATTCAAICIPTAGAPRVVLVAKTGGKFYISGTTLTYAISDADNGVSVE